jgi:prophage regulatory protein
MKQKSRLDISALPRVQPAANLLEPFGRRSEPVAANVHSTAGFAQSDRLLPMPEVLKLTAMSRSTLYNKLRAGEFVRPVAIGQRSIRFLESEVRAWIQERVAQRDGKERGL